MARWRELPESLEPHARALAEALREHKDRTELSIASIAARTEVSTSSWDRYLNGRALPSQHAIEGIARLAGAAPAPLLALRELAAEPPADQADPEPEPDPGPRSEPAPAPVPAPAPSPAMQFRPVPWIPMLLTSVTTALVMLAGLLVLAPWENTEGGGAAQDGAAQGGAAEDDGTLDEPPHPQFGEYTFEPGARHECDVDRDADDDLLYAGYSRSRTDLVLPDTQGWTVVEIQCLLEHHDIAPGAVDGQYSWATDRSVRRLQDQAHIAVDGIVGPDTWRVLRGQEEP